MSCHSYHFRRTAFRRRTILCSIISTMSLSSLLAMTRSGSSSTAFAGSIRHSRSRRLLRNPNSLTPLPAKTVINSNIIDESLSQQRSEVLSENSKLSLAPMMDYTDRHFRHLVRLLSDKTLLYTEMVPANAIAHERDHALSELNVSASSLADSTNFDPSYLLKFLGQGHNPEGPSVLQLGGSDKEQLFLATRTVREFNRMHQHQQQSGLLQSTNKQPPIFCDYSAINLNCGCPSPKVAGKGCFGAALMQDPQLVRQLTTSMYEGAEGTIPITVKCRIGTDEGYTFSKKEYLARSEEEEYQSLKRFVEIVASDGVVTDFQIHARIAVLNKKYSPADNRKVPPLRYDHVRRLAQEFPQLSISLNGGVDTLIGVKKELDECGHLRGVMVGRGFLSNPWAFSMADRVLYPDRSHLSGPSNRIEVLEAYGRHADYEEEQYNPTKNRRFVTKAISHLFAGEPNAKRYRIALDNMAGLPKKFAMELKQNPNAVQPVQPKLSQLIMDIATSHLSEEVLYRTPQESFDKLLWEEEQVERKRNVVDTVVFGGAKDHDDNCNAKKLIQEWQQERES